MSHLLAELLVHRSHGKIKLRDYVGAVEDAHKAYLLKPKVPRIHLCKGVAFCGLDLCDMAREAFASGMECCGFTDKSYSELKAWKNQCEDRILKLGVSLTPTLGPWLGISKVNGSAVQRSSTGKPFYFDDAVGAPCWILPQYLIAGDELSKLPWSAEGGNNGLPFGWMMCIDRDSREYFIDCAHHTVTRQDPRTSRTKSNDDDNDRCVLMGERKLPIDDPSLLSSKRYCIERASQLEGLKFCVREIVNHCVNECNSYDVTSFDSLKDIDWLDSFFAILEECLCYGLKGTASIREGFWGFMKYVCVIYPYKNDVINRIVKARGVHGVWRGRVWIALCLLSKQLFNYIQFALREESLLSRFYHPHAILRNDDDGNIFLGTLLGLNSIDFCPSLYIKRNWQQLGMTRRYFIDYSIFLNDKTESATCSDNVSTKLGTSALRSAFDSIIVENEETPLNDLDFAECVDVGNSNQLTEAQILKKRLENMRHRLEDINGEISRKVAKEQDIRAKIAQYRSTDME